MKRALMLAVFLAATVHSDITYMVDYLLPRGGTRGTTVEVEFHGIALDNPRQVLFYQPGIAAAGFVPSPKPETGFKVKFQIAPDCPLGEHVLRVRTATSLSDAVTFWVGRFPTVQEGETKVGENDTIAHAKEIRANTTVEGQIQPGGEPDLDIYRIHLNQGQRLSVEVEAARLGTLHNGGENDLAVRVMDIEGKDLGHNDDSALFVQDPMLSVVVPATGWYFVEIRQQIYYAPRQAWYRAHIGTFSRPTAIFPAGGQAGTTIEAGVLGDPTGERTESIKLPAKPGNFDYYTPADPPPSPNVLRVSAYPNVIWNEQPTSVAALPAALNGILDKPGEAQTYQFHALKNQAWKVQVFSRTLGAPVDARLWIRAANAPKHLVDSDDARMVDLDLPGRGSWYMKDQQDPLAVFKPPADGDYILGIEDATSEAGPDHVYRVEIEPLRDAIYTHITSPDFYQNQRLTGLIVPQGGRWTVDVQLAQGIGNNYKGDLELEASGLPAGVTMIAPRFAKGVNRLPVQFLAAPDAPQQAALVELRVKPVDAALPLQSGSRQSFALINRGGEMPWHFVFLDRYALAVTQPAPFELELEQPPIPLVQSGELLLKAKVVRKGDFHGPIEIQTDWLPPGVSKDPTVTIPPDKQEATFRIQANDKAAPGAYRVAMSGTTTGGDGNSGVGRVRASSAFVDLQVSEPYLSIDLQRGAVERGKEAEVIGILRQKKAFEGTATVRLQQLPRGVKMLDPAPEITVKDKQVVFHIAADADALAGLYKGVTCEFSFSEAGQVVRQHSGSGVLRVDAARGGEAGQ